MSKREFFYRWLKSPKEVGSLIPSSRYLCEFLASQINPESQLPIVELGAGTGVVTEALIKTGIDPEKIFVVERDKDLFKFLKKRFPELNIINGDATELKSLLDKYNINEVSAVVSSLPIINIDDHIVTEILKQAFAMLDGKGDFIQYTYSPVSPISKSIRNVIHLNEQRLKRVWRNIPPATVWKFNLEME